MAEKQKPIITPKFRVSFPEVFKPVAFDEDKEPRYSVVMLFPKKANLQKLKDALKEKVTEKWGKDVPKGLKNPFKDGDEKGLDGYEGHIAVTASSKYKPEVIDDNKEPIVEGMSDDDEVFYAGCFARAAVLPYVYEAKNDSNKIVSRGAGFRLVAIQKLEDGDKFVNRPNASELFDDEASDDVKKPAGKKPAPSKKPQNDDDDFDFGGDDTDDASEGDDDFSF